MESGGVADRESVVAAVDGLGAAFDALAATPFDALTHPELLGVLDRLETMSRRFPTLGHQIIARLAAEASPVELGATCLREVLTRRLRISRADARRRIAEAAELGPRTALSGHPLEPVLAQVAAAQAGGVIGAEHVAIIRSFFEHLPHWVDLSTREQAEATLCRVAAGLGPDELRKAAARLAALIDQDGPLPDDAERARRRHLSIGAQRRDGMSPITGLLDPQARATLDAILSKWAAPGMCNPDDENPTVTGTPTQHQIDTDQRTPGQRLHDAVTAIGRNALSSGELGQHNGLPVTLIVSTTMTELESGAGAAVTGGGTLLPMTDVIRLAAQAHHYLAITGPPQEILLYLGRTSRLASPGQRLVLHAKDRGCTFPGCTVPGYRCQVHHAECDWAQGGLTNITDETLACGGHNRLVKPGGWRTRKRRDGTTEWIPPPHLDTGGARTNDYHHPDRMLTDPD